MIKPKPETQYLTLNDRIIVVTGSARGLGEAFARACASDGARSIIIADILEDRGAQVAASLREGRPSSAGFTPCISVVPDGGRATTR